MFRKVYEIVGYVTGDCTVLCTDCASDGEPVFLGDTSEDEPTYCDECHYSLAD